MHPATDTRQHNWLRLRYLLIPSALWLVSACTSSAPSETPELAGQESSQATQTTVAAPDAHSPKPWQHAQWQSIAPGGDTSCSDGSAYRFYVKEGDPDKVVLYMQGGGGCWNRATCDPTMQPSYTRNIPAGFKPRPFGIFNRNNPANPLRDHTLIFAPYCTGDVHLGQRDTIYAPVSPGQSPLTIRHRGRTNMQAVLEWMQSKTKASEIFVTGSSAGAIPSPFYAVVVSDLFPAAKIAQLGDAAGGYRSLNNASRPDQQWGTFSFINAQPGFEAMEEATFNYEQLYIHAAKAKPNVMFAEYDAAEDAVQKRFLALSGSPQSSLLPALKANHADIRAAVGNFRAFITGGESHTVLHRPEFYSFGAQGKAVRDWVQKLVEFQPVNDVTCEPCNLDTFANPQPPQAMLRMWNNWQGPDNQVEPFQIFDNLYYVGIDWVAAYLLQTSEGLILIDSLYGQWIPPLLANIAKLGFDPADIKYVINTHGHFDHAGGARFFQSEFGATVVMAEEDWALASQPAELPIFYFPAPSLQRGIVAQDGDQISLGDTTVTLYKTPGHTKGVLTLNYPVHDADSSYEAITLGGVGLNFSGVERTQAYISSYERLQSLSHTASVSLPNHAAMGGVFQRAKRLANRQPGEPHPFVDSAGLQESLRQFLAGARVKLKQEKAGTSPDTVEALSKALEQD